MKKLLILLFAAIPLLAVRSASASGTAETQAAAALARRILPRLGAGIRFVHVPSDRDLSLIHISEPTRH